MKNAFHIIMNKDLIILPLFLILLIILNSCNENKNSLFQLNHGDLLFQNTGSDTIDNAIKSVTATSFYKSYSHVGMAMQKDNKWFVLEAIPKQGVILTPLDKFLNRNKTKFNKYQTTVARLETNYNVYISDAITFGLDRINSPYDEFFSWDDSSYYCSELVYKMFSSQSLPKDSMPFNTNPMTFNDSTGRPMLSWVNYYKNLNHEIPEGKIGTNPNLIASSPHIKFIHDYDN
tara:strand:+ start:809 stop:1504 length:696 start_codon:yes stop_codon:yes gene_type:complete